MGVARCLTKPVTQSQLFNAIAQSLGTAVAEVRPFDSIQSDRPGDFAPRRILLAEDGVVNQKVAIDLLTKRGHQVTLANNGKEALAALENQDFDLVLMDIQMPVMDGYAATAAIRQREALSRRHLPIIAMTAHAMAGDRERCLKAGMDAYVAKPFRPHELFRAVEETGLPRPSVPTSAAAEVGRGERASPQVEHDGNLSAEFDRNEALERVGGSEELLRDLVELFRSECPKQMDAIWQQRVAGDLAGLARAAHGLKGSVAMFAAQKAYEAALRIEKMGRQGDISDFDEAWKMLQESIDRLNSAFDREFAGERNK
jgi:CheY-like chemotaxis protein